MSKQKTIGFCGFGACNYFVVAAGLLYLGLFSVSAAGPMSEQGLKVGGLQDRQTPSLPDSTTPDEASDIDSDDGSDLSDAVPQVGDAHQHYDVDPRMIDRCPPALAQLPALVISSSSFPNNQIRERAPPNLKI